MHVVADGPDGLSVRVNPMMALILTHGQMRQLKMQRKKIHVSAAPFFIFLISVLPVGMLVYMYMLRFELL